MGATLSPGDIVDQKYKVMSLLGEGGMGAVYEGENIRIGRRVAIKVLHASASAHVDIVRRFEQEAQAAARVGSSHIVDVLDLGDLDKGHRYLVMEYLDGDSLAARLREAKTLAPAEIAPIAIQLLDGLAKVHDAGIVHRDLKPGNIFLCKSERGDFVKILDFGVCKFQQPESETSEAGIRTGVGKMMGTPSYMAPEQADASTPIDHRADIYSVGVMLYRAVSGRLPFQAETVVELITKLLTEAPPPLEMAAHDVDRSFAVIVNRAMARSPTDRYASALDFRKALVSWMRAAKRLDRLLADFLEVPEDDDDDDALGVAPIAPPRTTTSSRHVKAPVVPDDPTTLPLERGEPEPAADETHGEWGTGTPGPHSVEMSRRSHRRWFALAGGALVLGAGIAVAVCGRGDASSAEPRALGEPRSFEVAVEILEVQHLTVRPPPPPSPSASASALKPTKGTRPPRH